MMSIRHTSVRHSLVPRRPEKLHACSRQLSISVGWLLPERSTAKVHTHGADGAYEVTERLATRRARLM